MSSRFVVAIFGMPRVRVRVRVGIRVLLSYIRHTENWNHEAVAHFKLCTYLNGVAAYWFSASCKRHIG